MKKKKKRQHKYDKSYLFAFPSLYVVAHHLMRRFVPCLTATVRAESYWLRETEAVRPDSEHIVGELMKSFLFHRKISDEIESNLVEYFGEGGAQLAGKLEGASACHSDDLYASINKRIC